MKKHVLILFAALLVLSLFAGCRRKEEPIPTYPAVTTMPTLPETRPTLPSMTEDTEDITLSPTIEDGNGPIASQNMTEETR